MVKRYEAHRWLQRELSIKAAPKGLGLLGRSVVVETLSGEKLKLLNDNIVWVCKLDKTYRICFNELQANAGTSRIKIGKNVGDFVSVSLPSGAGSMLCNPAFVKFHTAPVEETKCKQK